MTHQGDLDQQNQKEVERIFQNKTKYNSAWCSQDN